MEYIIQLIGMFFVLSTSLVIIPAIILSKLIYKFFRD